MSGTPHERFKVGTGVRHRQETLTLTDHEAGAEAQVVPSLGLSCVAFRVATEGGVWSVLAEPPDDESALTRPGRFGIPIMYPWPNRMRDGRFSFGGRTYEMPASLNGPHGAHAIHGVVRSRPWTVEAQGADELGAFCQASVEIGRHGDDAWPFRTRLTVEYRLYGRALFLIARASNTGDASMPMGFGIHPWFGMPLGPGGSKQTLELRAPARQFWELDDTLCTTGAVRPVADGFDAQDWRVIGDTFIDDVYTDLPLVDGWFTAEIRDPASGRRVAVRSDQTFREHVVFAPRHGQAVCLEPYTCASDAFNLNARGLDAGTIVLEPGGHWQGTCVIEAVP